MMSDVRFSWTRSDANANEYVNALFGTTAVINLDALTSVQKSGQNPGTGIRMNIKNAYNATTGSTEFQAFVLLLPFLTDRTCLCLMMPATNRWRLLRLN